MVNQVAQVDEMFLGNLALVRGDPLPLGYKFIGGKDWHEISVPLGGMGADARING